MAQFNSPAEKQKTGEVRSSETTVGGARNFLIITRNPSSRDLENLFAYFY